MKITIIGPLCSGKSTLASDLSEALESGCMLEEAYRYYHSKGIDVPISENTTKESTMLLFDFSCKQVEDCQDHKKNYVILGSPFDEFMYTFHARKTAPQTELDDAFLHSLVERTRTAMQSFDLIFRVEGFQSIPYYFDNVRPNKDDSYRNEVDQTITELVSSQPPFNILDANIRSRICSVSGSREERVQQCLKYINQACQEAATEKHITVLNDSLFAKNTINPLVDPLNNFATPSFPATQ